MVVAPHAGDDGDHAGALEMEIKGTRRKAISYHNFKLHVILILLCTLLLCLDVITTVA